MSQEKELDFNRILTFNAEGDKETSLVIGVWQGRASITVFANRQPAVKIPFPVEGRLRLLKVGELIVKGSPGAESEDMKVQKMNQDRKFEMIATIKVGKSDKNVPYISIGAPGFQTKRFPVRVGLAWGADMEDQARALLGWESLAYTLRNTVNNAETLTSYKRDMSQQRGGGGNRGGYNGGGGQRQGGGGSAPSDDIF